MRNVGQISILLLAVLTSSCVHEPRTNEHGSTITIRRSSYRSTRQQAEADLVIYFESWDRLFTEKPAITSGDAAMPLTKNRLIEKLDELNNSRHFVVVVLQKSNTAPEEKLLDELEKFFQQCRFERVVIQQARGDPVPEIGQPILRDTAGTR